MEGAMSLNRVMALIGKSVVSDWRRGFAAYPLVVGIERAIDIGRNGDIATLKWE